MKHLIAIVSTAALLTLPISLHAGYGCSACSSSKSKTSKMESTSIYKTAKEAGQFTTLAAAVKAAGLEELLSSDGSLTVFAPTDEAFAKLPEGTLENLLKPENIEQLKAILAAHVVQGKVTSDMVKPGAVKTFGGVEVEIAANSDSLTIGGANIVQTDIESSNGVIHVIDSVIIPTT